jgi:hypothetical protein
MSAQQLKLFSIYSVFICLFIGSASYAQTTKRWVPAAGGAWTTAANWSPSGVPAANDDVIIPVNQTQPITAIPSISLRKFIILGNCQLEGANNNSMITVNDSFHVVNGITVSYGLTTSKFSITLASSSKGRIEGTFVQNSGTPSGTFNSNGTLEIEPNGFISGTGSFVLNSGATLLIGSTNGIVTGTTASGNIRVTGSRTFNAGANYIYDGTANQSTGTGLPTGLTGSLTIANDNIVTLSAARTITSGSLNLQKGEFAAGTLLSLGGSTTSPAVTVNRSEGLLSGTLQGANWYAVVYTGISKSVSSEVSGSGLRNLQLNMIDGEYLTLQNNLIVPGILTLTNGNLNAGTFTLTVNGMINGGSPLSYVRGRLQRSIAAGASNNFFPVGSQSGYAPVYVNFNAGTVAGTFTASTTEGDHPSIESSNLNVLRTVNRIWSLQPGTSLAATVYSTSMEWNEANVDASFDHTLAAVGRYASSGWTYPTISNVSVNTVALNGQSGVADYTVGKSCTYTSITKQPIGGAICRDGSIELSTEGAGDGTLQFQWLKDGSNITDANSGYLTVTEPGTYSVVVAGECRSATSQDAVVSLKPATVIKASPEGGMKCAGDLISVAAEGSGTLQYQWKRNDEDIEGATESSFAVTQEGVYAVSVLAECGTEMSSVAEVNMHAPTAVTVQPEDKEITYGEDINFSVEATGTGDLTYRWQAIDGNNWTNIGEENIFNGTNTTLLSLTKPSAAISGTMFKCVVTGFCGEAVSNEVNLIVKKAPVTITASDNTRIYGDENPEFLYTHAGLVNGESWENSGIQGAPLLVTPAVPVSVVGEYDIVPETGSLVSGNYTFEFVKGKLTVEQAPLTVTAVKTVRYYGDPNPDFSVEYNGLKNNETVQTCDVTGSPIFSTDANELSGIGTYEVRVDAGDVASQNYALSFANSTLDVERAILRVKPDDVTLTYGDTIPDLTFRIEGYKNGEETMTDIIAGNPVISTEAFDGSNAGIYDIVLSEGDLSASNYAFDLKKGTITINKANLQVVANNMSRLYGDANPVFTYGISGFVLGQNDATSDVTGAPLLVTSANNLSPVGNYDITISEGDLSSNNYQFTLSNASLTVNKATLSVTANDKLRIYGDPNPAFDVTFNGFKNAEDLSTSGVTGSPAFNTNASITSAVGTYRITPALGTLLSGNYQFNFVNGRLYIGKSVLIIRADTMRRDFGSSNPVFTYKFSGFKNGETLANSGVTGTPQMTTTATVSSLAGKYPINAAVGSLSATNYSFDIYGGELNIDLKLTVTSKNPVCPTVGDASLTLTAQGSPGTVEYSIDGGNTFGTNSVINELLPGTYTVRLRDDMNNKSRDTSVILKIDVAKWVGANNGNPSSRIAWENAANWNGGKVPGPNTHVIIPNISGLNVDINSNVQAASVQVGAGARLNVNPTFKLTTTGKCPVLPVQ